jgi:hypothetical protein
MPKKDIDKAPIIFRKTPHGLSPVSAFEQEALDRYPLGVDLEITIKQRRSLPQLKTYWKMLSFVNNATDVYPSAEHLHEALKLHMGYVTPLLRLDGKQEYIPDSTAFSAMDGAEFKVFMDRAVRTLAERFQLDPLSFMEERERAA